MDFSQNVNSKMWDLEKVQVSPLRIHGQEDVESQLVPSSIEWMSVCVCACVCGEEEDTLAISKDHRNDDN